MHLVKTRSLRYIKPGDYSGMIKLTLESCDPVAHEILLQLDKEALNDIVVEAFNQVVEKCVGVLQTAEWQRIADKFGLP